MTTEKRRVRWYPGFLDVAFEDFPVTTGVVVGLVLTLIGLTIFLPGVAMFIWIVIGCCAGFALLVWLFVLITEEWGI